MPASKKPRKKWHKKVTWQSAEKHVNMLIRAETWDQGMLDGFATDFLFPMDVLRHSCGKESHVRRFMSKTKVYLVISWILSRQLTDPEEMQDVIAETNRHFQIVFNCWLNHKRILYPELKKAREGMNTLFNTIRDAFEPWEVSTCHEQAVHNLKAYDMAENELDLQLPESWDIPVITTRREKRCLNA